METICGGIPEEFKNFLKYCKTLKFEETPDYEWVRDLFKDLYKKNKFPNDNLYDWSTKESNKYHELESYWLNLFYNFVIIYDYLKNIYIFINQ